MDFHCVTRRHVHHGLLMALARPLLDHPLVSERWHQLDVQDAAERLRVDVSRGLTREDSARRRAEAGPNVLESAEATGPWRMLWQQFTSTMVVVLIAAAVISLILGSAHDALAIVVILVLNAALGFTQEHRASRAMAALKQLAVPTVNVRRDGRVERVPAPDVVAGDVMVLEAGDVVAADGRIVEAVNLRTQEASLTGESEPVDKTTAPIGDENVALGDRRNLVFMGTVVVYGRGEAVVTETGMRTELGRIAGMLQEVRHQATPLQRRLNQLGRNLALVALAIVTVIFGLGIWRGESLRVMFFTAVSMAVAAVPEGLPAVVTIALALGAQRMMKRRALIRKLSAVETLGSVTVICADKTGTLTENRMSVAIVQADGHRVEGRDEIARESETTSGVRLLLTASALCNDASREGDELRGDPTEVALVAAAEHAGLAKTALEARFPRIAEIPFDSTRRRMTTVHDVAAAGDELAAPFRDARRVAFSKGAVEALADVCSHVWIDQRAQPLDGQYREQIDESDRTIAQDGMRVLGIAFKPIASDRDRLDAVERDLVFVGVVGLIDPPRPEVKDAVETCRRAGVRPVMITGDHPLTARHIARELGIMRDEPIVTGVEIEKMPRESFADAVDTARVFARVSPEHKLKIVEALQGRRQVVAMTGDGVNDAPALKKADIGVAMGAAGTEVAKQAADMVLVDDNFATIVAAVEEGRVIYDNIRKFVKYLLTTNSAELWLMLLAPLAGMPLPLLPLQILWINLVTDGPAALTLALEPPERHVMSRPPVDTRLGVLGEGLGVHVLWVGLLMGGVTLGTAYGYWQSGHAEWQTMVFTVLALSQMAHAVAIRSHTDSLFRIGVFSNPALAAAVTLTIAMQVAIIYVPFLQDTLTTRALAAHDLAIAFAVSAITFCAVELEKWVLRSRRRS